MINSLNAYYLTCNTLTRRMLGEIRGLGVQFTLWPMFIIQRLLVSFGNVTLCRYLNTGDTENIQAYGKYYLFETFMTPFSIICCAINSLKFTRTTVRPKTYFSESKTKKMYKIILSDESYCN